jgi:hypothetical protein
VRAVLHPKLCFHFFTIVRNDMLTRTFCAPVRLSVKEAPGATPASLWLYRSRCTCAASCVISDGVGPSSDDRYPDRESTDGSWEAQVRTDSDFCAYGAGAGAEG